jgi:predicted amidophosphoribosyltransferase
MVRGFEPAGLIARAAARRLGLPCRRWLVPAKTATVQKGLSAAQRKRNLAGAFRSPRELKGLRLLLVDDVRTTGTTLKEAARTLVRAGAVVHAATFAFTPRRDLDLYASKEPAVDSKE